LPDEALDELLCRTGRHRDEIIACALAERAAETRRPTSILNTISRTLARRFFPRPSIMPRSSSATTRSLMSASGKVATRSRRRLNGRGGVQGSRRSTLVARKRSASSATVASSGWRRSPA
jgi:hypothetical protein